ncbi:MAG: trehalose-phosphatase [Chloroflexota bacterium]
MADTANLSTADHLLCELARVERLWLFLDYDGTLADFAPTPDTVIPDIALVTLLSHLLQTPGLQLAIVSGRRLAHIHKLVPLTGLWLAGTYGVELASPAGERIHRLDYARMRPPLAQLKREWEHLTRNRPGFYLEDKGWSLAIHARFASEHDAGEIFAAATRAAEAAVQAAALRLQGGHRFLEISSPEMDKGKTVAYILAQDPLPEALPVFIGDDDKDELAFKAVKARQGAAIVVTPGPRPSQADFYLENPAAVRAWLEALRRLRTLT